MAGRYPFTQVRTQGREELYEYLAHGRGAVIITAHMGCMEMCRAMGEARGARINVLVHTRHAERFNRLLEKLSPGHGVRLMEVETAAELEAKISERTAMLFFLNTADRQGQIHHEEFVALGRKHSIPTLIDAADEWLELYRAAAAVQERGLPAGWTSWFLGETQKAEDVLWRTADRLAATLAQRVDTERIRQLVRRETEKLKQLVHALREARGGLAELTLSGGGVKVDLEGPEQRLHGLVRAVQELGEVTDEASA